jgi:nitroreductase
MDVHDAVHARRMVRSFSPRPVPRDILDQLLADALRAPSAGNTRGTALVVLEGSDETWRYWSAATTEQWRTSSRRWPGLSRAPVVVLSLASSAAYVERYAEPDKRRSSEDLGLGRSDRSWPVPYWFADAAFGVMTLLLSATSLGLGACFLGNFRREDEVLRAVDAPSEWRLFGSVVLGYPDGGDHTSGSLRRRLPDEQMRLHYGRWGRGGRLGQTVGPVAPDAPGSSRG